MIALSGAPLYQWDLGRQILITTDGAKIDEVHFYSTYDKTAFVVEPYTHGENLVADVPNILLTRAGTITACLVETGEGYTHTLFTKKIDVAQKKKPSDYIYTETEVKNYNDLEKRVEELEGKGVKGDKGDKGDKGEPGEKGEPFTYEDFTAEQLEALKGQDGKTPIKGTDYFTEADKSEFVTDVINALPQWQGGSY